jgi:hypothetical protein
MERKRSIYITEAFERFPLKVGWGICENLDFAGLLGFKPGPLSVMVVDVGSVQHGMFAELRFPMTVEWTELTKQSSNV